MTAGGRSGGMRGMVLLRATIPHLRKLAVLLLVISTLLFFLLRQAGDPAYVLAGAGATPEQLAAIREAYGLDRPLFVQYLSYIWNILHFDFGRSLLTHDSALGTVLARFPQTLQLAVSAMAFSILIAIPLGAWLGARPERAERRFVSAIVFVLQGAPGFVLALLFIQLFAVQLMWLPSVGYSATDWRTWVLPTLSLTTFTAPSLTRMIAANVGEAMREDYIRTARAYGAGFTTLLWRHALPNALLGASALIGVQFAHLLSGSAVIETIYSWPGMGWLLLESVQTLDFPVVQAEVFVIAILVFLVNLLTDLGFRLLDPRLRV
ncbi:ABC transporter permease [Sphingomonas crocodyli]|uniref:ABC transporter permease n=1 Tax=Sphingomonas crocodyli TaxID=1979270 RepID=A0A437LZZ0_9SPHN|nr:ABC transporter permease [Sphingomonas crocodyli]RVT90980.1 ABC transporter permease [Sphingomonas crocodyli]